MRRERASKEETPEKLTVVQTLKTETSARTMALDATRRRLELTIVVRLEQNQRMTVVRVLGRIFVVSALTFCTTKAMGDGSYPGQPLIQADFTRLVPISYPLVTTQFNSLKPTTYPVLQPGVARVHITEKLVHPMEQPLLRSN